MSTCSQLPTRTACIFLVSSVPVPNNIIDIEVDWTTGTVYLIHQVGPELGDIVIYDPTLRRLHTIVLSQTLGRNLILWPARG